MFHTNPKISVRTLKGVAWALLTVTLLTPPVVAKTISEIPQLRTQLIRILGTTINRQSEPVGIVAELLVALEQRPDNHGIVVTFESRPGRFSPMAQAAVLTAIDRTARAASLRTDSWTVSLTNPLPGVTVYGESLSAMVGLTVVALAKGDFIPPDRVITGTITDDGHIGTVGGVPLKVEAAHLEHLHRVLVPEIQDTADGDFQTPFMMQVSPVSTVGVAYQALTGRPF